MAPCARYGDAGQLDAGVHRAQHQAAAAHVAAAHEVGGKQQALAERLLERLHVFGAGHAAQQHELALGPRGLGEEARVPGDRSAITALAGVDVHLGVPQEPGQVDDLIGRDEPFARRDHDHARQAGRGPREGARVGQLAPEVQAAQEREDVTERRAPLADFSRQGEGGLVAEQDAGPLAAGVRGREQEDARDRSALGQGRTASRKASTGCVFSTSPRVSHPRRAMSMP